ncbi:hypothetical protein [Marinactinospora rubrisoli]|uniref:Uncharacterized protein n=1 Tax=Marinactinospora rubrisoli TaxID=2715399 RepID=A0ABW2KBK8_9ACTN
MSSSPLYLAIVVVWAIVLVPMLLRRDAGDPLPGPRRSGRRGAAEADDADGAPTFSDVDDVDDEAENGSPDIQKTQVLSYGADYVTSAVARSARAADERPARENAAGTAEAAGEPLPDDEPGPEDDVRADDPADDLDEEMAAEQAGLTAPPAPRSRFIARRRRRTVGLTTLLAATGVAVALGYGPWWVLVPPAVLLFGHLLLLREAAKADAERLAADLERRRRHEEARARREAAAAAREAEIVELAAKRDQVYDQYADAHLRAAGD